MSSARRAAMRYSEAGASRQAQPRDGQNELLKKAGMVQNLSCSICMPGA